MSEKNKETKKKPDRKYLFAILDDETHDFRFIVRGTKHAAISAVAGSVILMWFGELITEQGIGNGISMLIFASIISQLPTTLASLGAALFDTSSGSLSLFGWLNLPVNPVVFWIVVGFALALLLVIYFLVKLNEAQRVITINYAKRVHGNSAYGGIKSILPLKLIAAGVVPVIFATAFLSLPALIGQLIQTIRESLDNFSLDMQDQQPGLYYMHIRYPQSSQTVKLVIR